ncbi:MAG: AAA family ATPase [Fibrobacteres bacterium]|nr:AAA family ATPase [Fibrobacterota bacterium]
MVFDVAEIKRMNQLWDDFLHAWPLERVKNMTLEQYSSAGNKETFTYWLESRLQDLGSIWGGSAFKFGVYGRNDKSKKESDITITFGENYAWYTSWGKTEQDAFIVARKAIVNIIECVQKGDLRAIDNIKFGTAVKWKIAFQYQNREKPKVLMVFKKEMLETSLEGGGAKRTFSELNTALLNKMPSDTDLFNYSSTIWLKWADQVRIWKISHGTDLFTDEENTMLLKEKLVIVSELTKKGQGNAFINEAKIGDYIYLCYGSKRIVLIGKITGPATDTPKGKEWKSRPYMIIKEAQKSGSYEGDKRGWSPNYNSTFARFGADDLKLFEKNILKPFFDLTIEDVTNENTDNGENMEPPKSQNKFDLNTILYGPPGTGKTYKTVLEAARRMKPDRIFSDSDYKGAQKIFNEHRGTRIEFVTFHQNYSYEEFIQGLRPKLEGNGQLSFELKDGLFKKMAVNALFEYYKHAKKGVQNSNSSNVVEENEIFLDFVAYLKSKDNKEYQSISGAPIVLSGVSVNDNLEFKHANSSRIYTVSGGRLLKLFKTYPDISKMENINDNIRNAIGGCNSTVYWVALKEYIEFRKKDNAINGALEDESYEELNYESKKQLLNTLITGGELSRLADVKNDDVPQYVLIVDEINRANISRVFGELISLIEPDKRSHGAYPLICTLPSGEPFIVPSNLHIIGTMNTADKSIALLDIALRRRFSFISAYPDPELVGVREKEILQVINQQIIKMKNRDFQIGHSYFMEDEKKQFDLLATMNNKVIPLLMEYFMNDEKEVIKILVNAGLIIDESKFPIEVTGKKI